MENRSTFLYMIRPTRPGFVEQMLPEDLRQLSSETTFYLIGPCLDRAFGIAIFKAESLEAAHQMMAHDPAVERSVVTVEMYPFHISFLGQLEV